MHREVEAQLEADLDSPGRPLPCLLVGISGMFAVKSWSICHRAPWVTIDWLWGLIKKRSLLSGLESTSGNQYS